LEGQACSLKQQLAEGSATCARLSEQVEVLRDDASASESAAHMQQQAAANEYASLQCRNASTEQALTELESRHLSSAADASEVSTTKRGC
jgi:hypothetical protein